MANGLDEQRALEHAGRSARSTAATTSTASRVLAGIECDILPDGRLDLADDCLAELDIVDRLGPLRVQPGARRR